MREQASASVARSDIAERSAWIDGDHGGVSEVLAIPGSDDVVVMLDYLGRPGIADNLSRRTPRGRVVWTVVAPGPDPDGWDEAEIADGEVVAKSRSGLVVHVDLLTGSERSRERYR